MSGCPSPPSLPPSLPSLLSLEKPGPELASNSWPHLRQTLWSLDGPSPLIYGGPTLGSDKYAQAVGPRGAPALAEDETKPQNKPWATIRYHPPRASYPFPATLLPPEPQSSCRVPSSPPQRLLTLISDQLPAPRVTLSHQQFSPSSLSIPPAPVCYQHLPTLCQLQFTLKYFGSHEFAKVAQSIPGCPPHSSHVTAGLRQNRQMAARTQTLLCFTSA